MSRIKCKNHGECGGMLNAFTTLDKLCFSCKKKSIIKAKKGKIKTIRNYNKANRTDEQRARQRCDYYWSQTVKIANPVCWFDGCNRQAVEACHVMSRRHHSTRWYVPNGMGGCKEHHRWETDHPKEAKPLVRAFIGKRQYTKLEKMARTTIKHYLPELLEIEKNLKNSYKYYKQRA